MLAKLGRKCLVRFFSESLLPLPLYKRSLNFLKDYDPNSILVSKPTYDRLVRKPDDILVKFWDRESSFELQIDLLVPIFSFKTGEYSGQCVRLDHGIFNLPLRRDIVHRVQVYESKLGQSIIQATKTLTNVFFF